MPTVLFERTRLEIDAPDGGSVVDLCDDHPRAGVPFSCRHANCGTCRVLVREGIEHCAPAEDEELSLLEKLNAKPGHRLACQLRLKPGGGRVVLFVTL